MWPFSQEPTGDLTLQYNTIAGYTLPWLPCSTRSLQLAFPHLSVKRTSIPGYNGQPCDGFALYDGDNPDPALTVEPDGDSGYAFSIATHDPQALCLGRYRVGQSTLGDYHDDYLTEAMFWVGGSKIVMMAGPAQCSARFIFEPASGDAGDLTKASPDLWRSCVLTEMRYLIAARRTRPTAEIDDADAVKLLKKEKLHDVAPLPTGPNDRDPITLLQRTLYAPAKARNSYVKLADIALHNANTDAVKAKIKDIFKDQNDPECVATNIAVDSTSFTFYLLIL